MNFRYRFLIVLIAICTLQTSAQNRHSKVSNFPSYKGLIMAGYQGWFRAPGDGSGKQWGHYGSNGKFDKDHNTIDFWPDVSEYKKTYETSFEYSDGKRARVFSSVDKSTTDLHFKWMKDYGVDGVFMQRFFGVARNHDNPNKAQDIILRNAVSAAEENNRAFGVMYDLSGLKADGEDCSVIIEDWKKLVDNLKVFFTPFFKCAVGFSLRLFRYLGGSPCNHPIRPGPVEFRHGLTVGKRRSPKMTN